KQGLLSPGLNVPIFASSELEQQPVDDVVVLAWNFADPIIENNKLFLTGNRRFIVPLPNLRMVSADDF
ncbi:MAG: D-mycarose 3-C-methyltransferase, partial [Pseudomonadota bacterium]|nr:D-mycarose 3-C-methyltransferase [Pseudomonadota bacterium]